MRSSRLKLSGKRVSVALACTGGTRCTGTLSLKTAAKVKLGKRAKRVVTLVQSVKYGSPPAGAQGPPGARRRRPGAVEGAQEGQRATARAGVVKSC